MKILLGLLLSWVAVFAATAANYVIPDGPLPNGCTRSGAVVNCGSLSLSWGDTISVNGNNRTLNINGNANLSNAKINQGGSSSKLTINITNGNLNPGSEFSVAATIQVQGSINSGFNNSFTGDITADVINFGSSNTIAGNITAQSITTGSANSISGNLSALNITISSSNTTINGDLSATNNLNISSGATVNGSISGNTITTSSPVTLNGDVSAEESFILASGSVVNGSVTAQSVTMNSSNARVNGNIDVTDTLNVGFGGVVDGSVSAVHITNNGTITGSTYCQSSDGQNAVTCQPPVSEEQLQWLAYEQPDWLLDISGQGNHASSTGSAESLLLTSQISCSALNIPDNRNRFTQDAVDSQLDVNDIGEKGTISFWYRSNEDWSQIGRSKMLFDASSASSAQFALGMNSQGGISFNISESDGDTLRVYSQVNYNFTSDDWVHIAFSWNAINNTQKLHINGIQQSLVNIDNVAVDEGLPQLSTLYIGDNRSTTVSATGNSADGLIDEWRVYNYVQSSAQINADRTNTSDCPTPDLQCDNYTFQSASDFAQNWQVSTSSGSFIPAPVNGRVRLTEAVNNQSTRITLNKKFPAAGNRVEIEFDYYAYNGNSADGIAIVLSDANVTPQSGSFGGSLGYAQRNNGDAGFAGGWLGIGLDEYGNFSNPTEGRNGGVGFRPDSVALRGAAQNNYPFLKAATGLNPAIDVPGAAPGPAHRYRIVVDSQITGTSFISVSRDTGSGFVELISSFDVFAEFPDQQPVVPEDFLLSFTGSTGGSINIHEIDNLEVCAIKAEDIFVGPHHYRLQHNQNGYLCGASEVTVKACADPDCKDLYGNAASLSLTTDKGSWSATNLSFNASINSGLSVDETGIANIGAINPDPQAPVECYIGDAASNCEIDFVEVGLALSSNAWSSPVTDIPNQLSQRKFAEEIYVGLAQAGTCEADLQDQELELALDCVDPASCNNNMLLANDLATGDPTQYISTGITFNDQGIATIPAQWLRYDDAGQVQLRVRNSEQNAIGLSNAFVVKPTGLALSADNNNPHIAGADFTLTAQAVGAAGGITPNYNISDGIPGNPSDLYLQLIKALPLNEGEQGELSLGDQNVDSRNPAFAVFTQISNENAFGFNNGTGQTAVNYSEVGSIAIQLQDSDYMNAGSIGSNTLTLGRFIPAYFNVSADTPQLLNTCTEVTPFSYVGEAIGFDQGNELQPAIRIEARNMQNQITSNYADTFWRLGGWDIPTQISYIDSSYSEAVTANNDAQQLVQLQLDTYDGEGIYRIDNAEVTYKKGLTPLAPFDSSLAITISEAALTDSDGVCFRDSPTASCQEFSISNINSANLRYGRARLSNAYGQETEPLPVPLQLEYYNSTRWILNTDDNCTAYNAGDLQLTTTLTTAVSGDNTVTGGRPLAPMQGFVLAAPGESGEVEVLWQPLPVWLKFDWQGDGATLTEPAAVATFGQFRGNDRIIHWREVFE